MSGFVRRVFGDGVWQFFTILFGFLAELFDDLPRQPRLGILAVWLLVFVIVASVVTWPSLWTVDSSTMKRKPPLVPHERRHYWQAAILGAWLLLLLALAAVYIRLAPPIGWEGAQRILHALEILGGLALVALGVLWFVRVRLERDENLPRANDIRAVQYALVLIVVTATLATWDALWREFRYSQQGIASVILTFDRSQTALATEADRICADHGFAAARIDLICEDTGLSGSAAGHLDDRMDQYRAVNGYQGAILLAKPGPGMTAPDLLVWPQEQHATLVLDDSIKPGQLYVDVAQQLALLKQGEAAETDVARLAVAACPDLVRYAADVRSRPALAQMLVNASLNTNETAGLDCLGPVLGKALLADAASLPSSAQRDPPVEFRLTAARWLSHMRLYNDADAVLQDLAASYGSWEDGAFKQPQVETLALQARAETRLAECESPEAPDRSRACAEAVESFTALKGKAPAALAAYNLGRAKVVAALLAAPTRSGSINANPGRADLQQALSTSPQNCLHIDAARWLGFAETIDFGPEDQWQPSSDAADCPFTVFVDAPRPAGEDEVTVRVGMPASRMELQMLAPKYAAEPASFVEESPGVYSGTLRLTAGPREPAPYYIYFKDSRAPAIRLLQSVPVEMRDAAGRVIATWPAQLARPLEVGVTLNDQALDADGAGRVITATAAAEISLAATLQGRLPTVSDPVPLTDPDILEGLTVCLGRPEGDSRGCAADALARGEAAGVFRGSVPMTAANGSAYLVKVMDRSGAQVAVSEPFEIRSAEPPAFEPEQVTIVVFRGQVWGSMPAANEAKPGAAIKTFTRCVAARLAGKPEGLYLIKMEENSATIQGYIRPEQVVFERAFGSAQIPRLYVGIDKADIRGRNGEVVYPEPECSVYELLVDMGRMWQVTIYRPPGDTLPVEGNYIEENPAFIRQVELPRR